MEEVVVVNSGHSEKERGALSKYGTEGDLNIAIRDELVPELERQGFKVKVVPDSLNLKESIAWERKNTKNINSGLALSIHQNSGGGEGAETFYYNGSLVSRVIATNLITAFVKTTGIKSRGAKPDTQARWGLLGWIRKTRTYSTLIECGFIDSKRDMNKIIGHFDLIAEGIARGVCKIYGKKYIKKQEPKQDKGSVALGEIIKILKKHKLI